MLVSDCISLNDYAVRSCSSFFGLLMESGKFMTLARIGKVFYFVGFAAIVVSALGLLYFLVILGGRGSSILVVPLALLFYGTLFVAGGLIFQWLPQVSETLTKILNNIERLNEAVEKLAQPPEGDASVREPDGEGIQ